MNFEKNLAPLLTYPAPTSSLTPTQNVPRLSALNTFPDAAASAASATPSSRIAIAPLAPIIPLEVPSMSKAFLPITKSQTLSMNAAEWKPAPPPLPAGPPPSLLARPPPLPLGPPPLPLGPPPLQPERILDYMLRGGRIYPSNFPPEQQDQLVAVMTQYRTPYDIHYWYKDLKTGLPINSPFYYIGHKTGRMTKRTRRNRRSTRRKTKSRR